MKAPFVGALVLPPRVTEFKTGTSYTFSAEIVSEVFEDLSKRAVVYRAKGDTEWITTGSFDTTSYKITNCRFEKSGTLEVAVMSVDKSGNVGYGIITEISIAKDYEIILNGTVPTGGETGKTIVLPTATATDKNNVERSVTIKVEDVYGKSIPVTDNSFTPTEVGMYYVTYQSSYTENGENFTAKLEYTLVVTQGTGSGDEPIEPEPVKKGGCSSSLLSTVSLPVFVIALFAIVVIALRKRSVK